MIKKTLILINSILLIIIILFTPLAYYIFNPGYYATLYEDNRVFSILNKSDVRDITEKIFKFFKYESELDHLD
jgi:PDZ domain-containing secreted protein